MRRCLLALACLSSLAIFLSCLRQPPHDWRPTAVNVTVPRASSDFFVSKVTHSSSVRFLFLAGLEGTRHHGWSEVFRRCSESHGPCKFPGRLLELQRSLYTKNASGLFNPGNWTPASYAESARNVSLAMAALKQSSEALYLLNGAQEVETLTGMMSYPNFRVGLFPLHRPDLRMLAELAEQVAADLRILVLRRGIVDMIVSTVFRRNFSTLEEQVASLTDNALALFGQLTLLDRRFVYCVPTGPIDAAGAARLGDFLHPRLSGRGSGFELWQQALAVLATQAPSTNELGKLAMLKQLFAATSLIDDYCDRQAA
ncbi:unnamed protein product [Symbiodinium natans]|uniref:Uncharacterized protein n=1 Tax=Symbiodinium natans TaxID=878477 RepID=A0A812QBX1_9DINO|nr:unnamed protein product [Symbiodinium natans]